MDQKEKQSKLLKAAKLVIEVSNQGKCLTSPLDTGLNVYILGTRISHESHMPSCLLKFQGPNQNMSSTKILTTSGNEI